MTRERQDLALCIEKPSCSYGLVRTEIHFRSFLDGTCADNAEFWTEMKKLARENSTTQSLLLSLSKPTPCDQHLKEFIMELIANSTTLEEIIFLWSEGSFVKDLCGIIDAAQANKNVNVRRMELPSFVFDSIQLRHASFLSRLNELDLNCTREMPESACLVFEEAFLDQNSMLQKLKVSVSNGVSRDIGGARFEEALIKCLPMMKDLCHLDITTNSSALHDASLKKGPSLDILSLDIRQHAKTMLDAGAGLPRKELNIRWSPSGFAVLTGCVPNQSKQTIQKIHVLYVNGSCLQSFANLRSLKELSVFAIDGAVDVAEIRGLLEGLLQANDSITSFPDLEAGLIESLIPWGQKETALHLLRLNQLAEKCGATKSLPSALMPLVFSRLGGEGGQPGKPSLIYAILRDRAEMFSFKRSADPSTKD
ncbi:expressed unknown protein [Seminavis robusta]|uniref:Uncharacterized protein n=1 Tax=Seminavis robusta TaxID=568900 RepID=A0A9N8DCZ3_9STRA|nr:expressed unknown protein [Seminavis robusta]|eukprot:Sro90_g047230.1 n/a (423) ;mRNA; f:15511-16779